MFEYYFDKIFCINLDKRKDKWIDMEKQFTDLNVIPCRIPGVEGNVYKLRSDKYPHPKRAFDGVSGGTMAHLNTYIEAYSMKCKAFLVVEDDCIFHNDFKKLWLEYTKELPNDWDLLYLGGMFEPSKGRLKTQTSEHIFYMSGIMATHCYAVKDTILLKLISTFLKDYPYLTDSADGFLCKVQEECNTYALYPPLTWQLAGWSDIQNEYRDYEERFKKLI